MNGKPSPTAAAHALRFLVAKPKTRICLKRPKRGNMGTWRFNPSQSKQSYSGFKIRAAQKRIEVIIQTRIALNSHEARLLEARQKKPLATIRY